VQPACAALNVVGNAASHAAAVRSARSRLVVFPELSLTGYELHAPTVPLDGAMLEPIVDACGETGSVALVGAPVEADGARFIAMLRVDAAGVRVVYRKTWLGICKDTGAAQHTVGTAALGVDAYVAGLVHRPEELPEQEARAVVIARTCRAFVVFASFAGRCTRPAT
jgi:hypothetical protein